MTGELNIATLPSLPFSDRAKLPTIGAVYIICGADQRVLYVGATLQLRDRLKSHHRRKQFGSIEHVSIAWIEEDHPKRRLKMEAELIKQLDPKLNRNSVPLTADSLVNLTALVTLDTFWAVKRLAEQEERTVSNFTKRLIEQALKDRGAAA